MLNLPKVVTIHISSFDNTVLYTARFSIRLINISSYKSSTSLAGVGRGYIYIFLQIRHHNISRFEKYILCGSVTHSCCAWYSSSMDKRTDAVISIIKIYIYTKKTSVRYPPYKMEKSVYYCILLKQQFRYGNRKECYNILNSTYPVTIHPPSNHDISVHAAVNKELNVIVWNAIVWVETME